MDTYIGHPTRKMSLIGGFLNHHHHHHNHHNHQQHQQHRHHQVAAIMHGPSRQQLEPTAALTMDGRGEIYLTGSSYYHGASSTPPPPVLQSQSQSQASASASSSSLTSGGLHSYETSANELLLRHQTPSSYFAMSSSPSPSGWTYEIGQTTAATTTTTTTTTSTSASGMIVDHQMDTLPDYDRHQAGLMGANDGMRLVYEDNDHGCCLDAGGGLENVDNNHHHHHHHHLTTVTVGNGLAVGVPVVRTVKRRYTANRKERRRTLSINNAFADLRDCIPNVPADTKLSKIKTLRLATSYIAYLMDILAKDDPSLVPEGGFKAEVNKKIETREEKKKREMASLLGSAASEKRTKGRTGWPQHVWALELKQ